MSLPLHPTEVLYRGERPFPAVAVCVHYAGREDFIQTALELQKKLGPVFDIACDCEDGAPAGSERKHAEMVARNILGSDNQFGRVGARIHDFTHHHWREDLEILIRLAGACIAFIAIPKVESLWNLEEMVETIRNLSSRHCGGRKIPLHVLIETHGSLREINSIASLPEVETIDFGIMDFVSAHRGVIPASAMTSPGQFEHPLIRRAKCEIVSAAIGNGIIPVHNVTRDFRNPEQTFADAKRAREEFGFLRMWSIHPAQIEPIVKAMGPRIQEVDEASEILLAAREVSWAPLQMGGKLHDRASYRYYWDVLQRAKATGIRIPSRAVETFFSSEKE